jgi:glycosyltransferase involved in cell wall biosynthesis
VTYASGNRSSFHCSKQPETLAIVFHQFAPYHVDRIAATHSVIGRSVRVIGIELSDISTMYSWERTERVPFPRVTLFPSENWQKITPIRRMFKLLLCLRRVKARSVFLINYHLLDTFLSALILRISGVHVYIMMASKLTDRPRVIWKEGLKRILFFPYVGGIASGRAHLSYLDFLGVGTKNFRTGLDTLSVSRVRERSGSDPAPQGTAFAHRHFTIIARMVPEKDIPTALHAYALYRRLCRERGTAARDLVLCGEGPEKDGIQKIVQENDIRSVIFLGHLEEPEICKALASTLALILSSRSETWGLVINEAVAMGVPVLCSDICGAGDELVRVGMNGFIFHVGASEELAELMILVSSCEEEWKRMSLGSLRLAPMADSSRFAHAVASLLQLQTDSDSAGAPAMPLGEKR